MNENTNTRSLKWKVFRLRFLRALAAGWAAAAAYSFADWRLAAPPFITAFVAALLLGGEKAVRTP